MLQSLQEADAEVFGWVVGSTNATRYPLAAGKLWVESLSRSHQKLANNFRHQKGQGHSLRRQKFDTPPKANSVTHQKDKKAAPRFELGVKDLQSSALPLGHAAGRGANSQLRIVSAIACQRRPRAACWF